MPIFCLTTDYTDPTLTVSTLTVSALTVSALNVCALTVCTHCIHAHCVRTPVRVVALTVSAFTVSTITEALTMALTASAFLDHNTLLSYSRTGIQFAAKTDAPRLEIECLGGLGCMKK